MLRTEAQRLEGLTVDGLLPPLPPARSATSVMPHSLLRFLPMSVSQPHMGRIEYATALSGIIPFTTAPAMHPSSMPILPPDGGLDSRVPGPSHHMLAGDQAARGRLKAFLSP